MSVGSQSKETSLGALSNDHLASRSLAVHVCRTGQANEDTIDWIHDFHCPYPQRYHADSGLSAYCAPQMPHQHNTGNCTHVLCEHLWAIAIRKGEKGRAYEKAILHQPHTHVPGIHAILFLNDDGIEQTLASHACYSVRVYRLQHTEHIGLNSGALSTQQSRPDSPAVQEACIRPQVHQDYACNNDATRWSSCGFLRVQSQIFLSGLLQVQQKPQRS